MVLRRAKNQFITHYSHPRVRRGLKVLIILGIGIGWVFSRYITNVLSIEQTVLLTLVLLLVSIEVIETKIYDIEDLFDQPLEIFRDNYEVKDEVSEYLGENQPDKGFIISYSGSTGTSKSPIKELIQNGSKVHILAKNPRHTVNRDETELIIEALKSRYQFDKEYTDIEVRFYHEQASMKGLKMDGLLVLSWYTFADDRGRQVMGHENPAIKVTTDQEYEFELLNNYFEDVYFSLWSTAISPIELYEHEDCPVALKRWVDRQQDTEREDWLRAIGGTAYETRQQMFQEG